MALALFLPKRECRGRLLRVATTTRLRRSVAIKLNQALLLQIGNVNNSSKNETFGDSNCRVIRPKSLKPGCRTWHFGNSNENHHHTLFLLLQPTTLQATAAWEIVNMVIMIILKTTIKTRRPKRAAPLIPTSLAAAMASNTQFRNNKLWNIVIHQQDQMQHQEHYNGVVVRNQWAVKVALPRIEP